MTLNDTGERLLDAIKEKVIAHEYAIKQIGVSLHNLAESTKESNEKLGTIANSMTKQEVILEKLTNLETNSKASVNRVHKRVDAVETELKECHAVREEKGCTVLQLLYEKSAALETDIGERIDTDRKQLDKITNTIIWGARTIIGTIIISSIGLLFYIVRGHWHV